MFDVNTLIETFGFIGILAIIFAETGILIGFILPGDTLLFTAGVLAALPNPFAPLWALLIGIPLAAMAGDQLGFYIGRKVGPHVLKSRAMRWIGPDALDKTNHYFDRFGAPTVMLARFIGVVRTLTPVVAGISDMSHRSFTFWSIIGSTVWGVALTSLGYWLGNIPIVERYVHWFVVLGVASVIVPGVTKLAHTWWKNRR